MLEVSRSANMCSPTLCEQVMPNNRQWAFLLWALVFLVWVVARRDMRSSVRDVLGAAATPKILLPMLALTGWVVGLTYGSVSSIKTGAINFKVCDK